MSDPFESNYYEVLEVAQDAPQHEIHEAFQRAKRTYSVDSPALYSMFSQEEAQQLIKLIEEAFAVLGNQARRKVYDEKLRLKKEGHPLSANGNAEPVIDPNDWNTPAQETDGSSDWMPTSEPVSPPAKPTAKTFSANVSNPMPTPEGERLQFGRTPLSSYKLNQEMEDEIARQTVYDGTFIRKIREYKNVDLGQLSDATKVSRSYLQAIESNRFTDLPAPVFVRGFLIQITRMLGLESQTVAASYIKLMKESINR